MTDNRTCTVGTMAADVGVSVRTLRHYDAIGLLQPAGRTRSGRRLYTDQQRGRLTEIVVLREVGLSLTDIRRLLDHRDAESLQILHRHVAKQKEALAKQEALCRRADALVAMMEVALNITASQSTSARHAIQDRAADVRARLQDAMRGGAEPSDPQVQALIEEYESIGLGVLGACPSNRV